MLQAMSLQKAETETLRLAMFKDGLWDIFLGCGLLTLSIYPLTRAALGPALNLALILVVLGIEIVCFYAARRHFILPRIGLVKLGASQKAKLRFSHFATFGLVILTVGFFLVVVINGVNEPAWEGAPQWLQDLDVDIFFSLLIVGLFALLSHVLGIPRLLPYGWLFGGANLASTVLDVYYGHTFPIPIALVGALILVVGCSMFARFLREYPVPTPEV
jgi:hypothetical protein